MPFSNGPDLHEAATVATPSSDKHTSKRKRSYNAIEQSVQKDLIESKKEEDSASRIQSTIRDFWTILKDNDTDPSILDRLLSLPANNERSAKRAKLAAPISPESIASKVEQNAYLQIEDFVNEFDVACEKLIHEVKPLAEATHWKYVPDNLEQDKTVASVHALQTSLKALISRNASMTPSAILKQQEELKSNPKLVLTLYGNAQGHKQLFSSFQNVAADTKSVEFVTKLRENGLPNGIMSTMVVPMKPKDAASNLKKHTFKDVFGPPSSLAPLAPPQPGKQAPDGSSPVIVWGAKSQPRPERPLGYAYQKTTAGRWLGYGGLASSPLKGGSGRQTSNKAETLLQTDEDRALAEEDALFRSVYSAFAPSHDNSGAVYSEQVKNEMWWQKRGRSIFEESLGFSAQDSGSNEDEIEDAMVVDSEGASDDANKFDDIVEAYDPALEDFKVGPPPPDVHPSNDDEILDDISQLLETLHSYQRTRSMTRKTQTHDTQSSKQSILDDPSIPTEMEVETYKTLKAQLALIIATLPPYAVSRLNGDQLEDLNISLRMPIEDKNIRGVMEEDASSRAAKAAALSAAIGNAVSSARAAPLATPVAGARTAPMVGGRNAQSYSTTSGQNLLRQTSQLNSRQPLNGWQTPTRQSLSATAPRPSYQTQASYGTQSAKPVYNNYRNTTVGQFQSSSSRQANTPLAGKNTYSGAGSTGYQPRAGTSSFSINGQGAQQASVTNLSVSSNTQQRPAYLTQPIQVGTPTVGSLAVGDGRAQTPGLAAALRSVSGTPQPTVNGA